VSYLRELYATFIRVSLSVEMQYRAANVIWLMGMIMEPVIYLAVWSAVAAAQGGSVGGFSPADFAAYYLVYAWVNQFTSDWHMWEFDARIQHGIFAFQLLRPVHPIHGDVAENLAHKVSQQVTMLPALIVLGFVFHARLTPQLWALAAFVPALLLAFAVRFLWEWSLALAAFWTTRISAVNRAYFVALMFLSGRVAPVGLLPRALQALGDALPFRWMVGFPVELLLGRVTPRDAGVGLLAQLGWLGGGALVLRLLWPRAVRRFGSVGG
jgi:viologen exporter family transport system permease protein